MQYLESAHHAGRFMRVAQTFKSISTSKATSNISKSYSLSQRRASAWFAHQQAKGEKYQASKARTWREQRTLLTRSSPLSWPRCFTKARGERVKAASLENIPAHFGFDRIQRHSDRNGRNKIKNEPNDGEQCPEPRISSGDAYGLAYGLMHPCPWPQLNGVSMTASRGTSSGGHAPTARRREGDAALSPSYASRLPGSPPAPVHPRSRAGARAARGNG